MDRIHVKVYSKSMYPSIHPPVHPSICVIYHYLPINLSLYQSTHPSNCLFIHVFIPRQSIFSAFRKTWCYCYNTCEIVFSSRALERLTTSLWLWASPMMWWKSGGTVPNSGLSSRLSWKASVKSIRSLRTSRRTLPGPPSNALGQLQASLRHLWRSPKTARRPIWRTLSLSRVRLRMAPSCMRSVLSIWRIAKLSSKLEGFTLSMVDLSRQGRHSNPQKKVLEHWHILNCLLWVLFCV